MVAWHSKEIARKLKKIGFVQLKKKKHHVYYTYQTQAGEILYQVETYLSHAGKDYGIKLLSEMAVQLKVTKQELLRLLEGHMTRDEYEEILRTKGYMD